MEDIPIEPIELLKEAVQAAWDSKAENIVVIDLTGRVAYADHIVLCSGSHPRHVAAIALRLVKAVRDAGGPRPLGIEGLANGRWALVDFGDFIVHVFDQSQRSYYDLDGLWADGRRLSAAELGINTQIPLGTVDAQPFSSEA